MTAADAVLLGNVIASGACLVAYLLRRRHDRATKAERVSRALRIVVQQEVAVAQEPAQSTSKLVLQQAN